MTVTMKQAMREELRLLKLFLARVNTCQYNVRHFTYHESREGIRSGIQRIEDYLKEESK